MTIQLNVRQAKRILNVARSLDESADAKAFTMKCFIRGDHNDPYPNYAEKKNWCGTPACALGNYAARRDLQKVLTIKKTPYGSLYLEFSEGKHKDEIDYENEAVHKYFGVDEDTMYLLFGPNGCNDAKKPATASKFLKTYVKKHTTKDVQRKLNLV